MSVSEVIFVKMREMLDGYYDGYRDYFHLAELSGYKVIWLDEVDVTMDNTYIITPRNGSWHNGWPEVKARIIHHDIEWRLEDKGFRWAKADYHDIPGVAEVWASDKWYAGIIGAKYVPLGSHPGLVQEGGRLAEQFDVTLQSYMSGRRTFMADRLIERGATIAPARWNPERDTLLKSTTAMLHIHQWDNIPTVAPLRFAIAAAYGIPLISEQVEARDIFNEVVLFCQYEAMPDYVPVMVRRYPERLKEHGAALKELLTGEYSFRNCVERAL